MTLTRENFTQFDTEDPYEEYLGKHHFEHNSATFYLYDMQENRKYLDYAERFDNDGFV